VETELDAIWQKALENIQRRVNLTSYNTWFVNTEPVAIHEGSFIISTPNKFAQEWLEDRHLPLIKTALEAVLGEAIDVRVTVRKEGPARPESPPADPNPPTEHEPLPAPKKDPAPRKSGSSQFNPRYVFDNFVVGDGNQFAHAASIAVAENPAKAYNPLFIYGGAGLGKTHLMHAIGIYANSIHPEMNVKYITTEAFTNEFISSIRANNPVPFQKKYRTVDILLIDDIQFIINKAGTQEEFFHIFNTLYEGNKQIVISSDRPPKELPTLEDRLRSRFEWGLIVDIQPPNLETRVAILQKKAEESRIEIGDDVLQFIAGRRQLNVRELEGALTRIAAFADLTNTIIDVSLAKNILKEILPERKPKRISTRQILSETAKYFGISVAEMTGKDRSKHISYPRQVAMYLVRELTDSSLPKIGDDFGGRDHTTVMHGISKIAASIKKDQEIKIQVQELENRIKQKDS
jgi:chromosomal replication initiator protein